MYNIDLFGKELVEKRKSLNLTQKEISKSSGVDSVTIRRIEKGKVIPKLETLEFLSPFFKVDLISLLLEYRFDDYSVFNETKNRIEKKLVSLESHTVQPELKELNAQLNLIENPYYTNLIMQFILFTESSILYEDTDYQKSLNKFIKAIKITTPDFRMENYKSFLYSSMEVRILMNISFVLNKLNNKDKYLEILEFCVDAVDIDDEIYPKLCHNLAGAYIRNKYFEKSLEYSINGIKSCQVNQKLNGINILFYGKGIAEYRLNKEEYVESIRTSIYLCRAFGQKKLENIIISNCKEILGVNIDLLDL